MCCSNVHLRVLIAVEDEEMDPLATKDHNIETCPTACHTMVLCLKLFSGGFGDFNLEDKAITKREGIVRPSSNFGILGFNYEFIK